MASSSSDKLELFQKTGMYRFEGTNAVFMDPVRVLNRCYTHHKVKPSAYYSRFFSQSKQEQQPQDVSLSRKRKKTRERKPQVLNHREQLADRRHQDVRPLLLMAHEALLGASDLLTTLRNLKSDFDDLYSPKAKQSFVELVKVSPSHMCESQYDPNVEIVVQFSEDKALPLLCNSVMNQTSNDVGANVLNNKYVLPRKSCFYMSDLGKIHNLIPAESNCGFNLVLIDPPWENGSARQKLKYVLFPSP